MKTQEEQIKEIRRIMGTDKICDFIILGKTFDIKEDLKSWACYWDSNLKAWRIDGITKDDPFFKFIKEQDRVWVKEV